MFRRWGLVIAGGVPVVVAAVSCTANDGWPDVRYDLAKLAGVASAGAGRKKKKKVLVLGSGWGALSMLGR